ncbi:MAG: zf-TFIIB domain-containing protein [Desulfobacteraceae bacterium]|jgi:hypothetical protein
MSELVKVCIQTKLDDEKLFFAEEDAKLIRDLRDKNKKNADNEYQENHSYHCFRCGTRSLVEVDRGDIKIDICANENCGAVHLDPGELENILKDGNAIKGIRKSFLSIFK